MSHKETVCHPLVSTDPMIEVQADALPEDSREDTTLEDTNQTKSDAPTKYQVQNKIFLSDRNTFDRS